MSVQMMLLESARMFFQVHAQLDDFFCSGAPLAQMDRAQDS